jgi:hypothetical protein
VDTKNAAIGLRGGSRAEWELKNPILLRKQMGAITTPITDPLYGAYKVGDGVTRWNDLPIKGWTDLSDYYTKEEVNALINTLGGNIGDGLAAFYTKNEIDAKVTALNASISALSTRITTLETKVNTVDAKIRRKATGTTSFYLNPNGNDNNDGLTSATPKKTFAQLASHIRNNWDFSSGYSINIYLSAGNFINEVWTIAHSTVGMVRAVGIYGAGVGLTKLTGSSSITPGAGGTGRNGIEVSDAIYASISGITFINNLRHIGSHSKAITRIGDVELGPMFNAGSTAGGEVCIYAHDASIEMETRSDGTKLPGMVNVQPSIKLSFGSTYYPSAVIYANRSSMIRGTPAIVNSVAGKVGVAFARAAWNSLFAFWSGTITGEAITGKRWQADLSSSISGANLLNVAAAGSTVGTPAIAAAWVTSNGSAVAN